MMSIKYLNIIGRFIYNIQRSTSVNRHFCFKDAVVFLTNQRTDSENLVRRC